LLAITTAVPILSGCEIKNTSRTDGYVKPDGWKTVHSTEYPFAIDVPEDWVVKPHSCGGCQQNSGVSMNKPQDFTGTSHPGGFGLDGDHVWVAFAVQEYTGRCIKNLSEENKKLIVEKFDANELEVRRLARQEGLLEEDCSTYAKIPLEKRLIPIEENSELVAMYGEAFRYFNSIHISTGIDSSIITSDPFFKNKQVPEDNEILIGIENPTDKNIVLVKTIVRSFRLTQ